jgi:signal transduction histidine kinase
MTSGSLRLRLLAAAALSILAALIVAGFFLSELFERHVERRVEQELDNHLRQILAVIEPGSDGKLVVASPLPDSRFELPFSGLYWQIQENGNTIAASPSLGDETLQLPPPTAATGKPVCVEVPGPLGRMIVLIVRDSTVKFGDVEHKLRLAAAIDQSEVDTAVRDFRKDLAGSLGILGLCLLIAAWLQVIVGLQPLERLRHQLVPVREGRDTQLEGRFPTEISPLVDDLNSLLTTQQNALVRARARAGELAHGLKTPLTALNSISRDLADRKEAQTAAEIMQLVGRMQAHVGRELSRAQIALKGKSRPETQLLRPIEQLVDTLRRAPRGDAVEWIIDIDHAATIAIESEDLTELLGNLLENALKWSKSIVRITADGPSSTFICVEDDGPGVPNDKLELIRTRGTQLDPAHDGSGLGLAIANDIADAYTMQLELGRSADLGGFRARICLTSAMPDAAV